MGEIVKIGVPIELDTEIIDGKEVYIERKLVFSYNVIQNCVEKFGEMDNILNSVDLDTVKWLAAEMVNADAAIWNRKHPDNKKSFLTEDDIGIYVIGMQGLIDLQKKVREAMFLGLDPDQVKEAEEIEKNLMTAQVPSGKTASLLKWLRKK